MRLSFALLLSILVTDAVAAAAAPGAGGSPHSSIEQYTKRGENRFERRRGGGGGGGGRGGGGSSSSSGGSSGGSGRGSTSSSSGGKTTTGSGPPPAYGGGRYYGGGAAVPYKSGSKSPSGISPFFLGAGIGMLAFWPGWYYGAHLYNFNRPYSFYNASSKQNETHPVTCGCDPYLVCGCDENGDPQYLSDIVGNGTNLNSSLVAVAVVDNKQTILINGSLPNGTTAAGGDEDPFGSAGAGMRMLLQNAGWWPLLAIVSALVFTAQ